MRAGPLSNAAVVEILNRRFVSVYTSNEDYFGKHAVVSAAERAALEKIHRAAHEAKLSVGTVHAYVLTPEGTPIDSLHVAEAAKVERTREMLEHCLERLGAKENSHVVPGSPQSMPPRVASDALVLHLTARYLRREGNAFVPLPDAGLGQTRNASWQAYPAENWIVYSRTEATGWIGSDSLQVGSTWPIDRELAKKLLVHFYPPTECNDTSRNRLQEYSLHARVIWNRDDVARARLDGRIELAHRFYPGREDDNAATAQLVGYLDFEPSTRRVLTFRLVTDAATYARQPFGVAVRSVR